MAFDALGQGPPLLWGYRGLRRFGATGDSAALGTRSLCRFGNTMAFAALGQGPPLLWGYRGSAALGQGLSPLWGGVSAASGTMETPPLWERWGSAAMGTPQLFRFGAGASAALVQGPRHLVGTPGPSPFWGGGLCYFGNTGASAAFRQPPPPPAQTHRVACPPESPRSTADKGGVGTHCGGMVLAGAVPPPHIAADTPESPRSRTDCVGIGALCGGTRHGSRAISRGLPPTQSWLASKLSLLPTTGVGMATSTVGVPRNPRP